MTIAAARAALCSAALSACLFVTGCVATGTHDPSPEGPGSARTPTGEAPAPQTAMNMVVLGKSGKADIAAALGTAIVISFDSGYEVWVYRWRGPDKTTRSATELVVLFDPSGLATKARLRPGYETPK
jgi:hypothetical protein